MEQDTPTPTTAFTVRLDGTMLGALDTLAEKTERSRNWLVTQAIEDYIALNAWQVAKIEKGIAEADRGEFASEEEVMRVFTKKYSKKKKS